MDRRWVLVVLLVSLLLSACARLQAQEASRSLQVEKPAVITTGVIRSYFLSRKAPGERPYRNIVAGSNAVTCEIWTSYPPSGSVLRRIKVAIEPKAEQVLQISYVSDSIISEQQTSQELDSIQQDLVRFLGDQP